MSANTHLYGKALDIVADANRLSPDEVERRLTLCPDCLQFDGHEAWCENEQNREEQPA